MIQYLLKEIDQLSLLLIKYKLLKFISYQKFNVNLFKFCNE